MFPRGVEDPGMPVALVSTRHALAAGMSRHMALKHVFPDPEPTATSAHVNVANRGRFACPPRNLAQPVSTVVAYVKLALHPDTIAPSMLLVQSWPAPSTAIFDASLHHPTALPPKSSSSVTRTTAIHCQAFDLASNWLFRLPLAVLC